jgi:membrane-associated protease RseP (regulator of RpoE activity)
MFPIAGLLFVLTCASTWAVGGPTYALAVMGILLAHELGHYVQTLYHRVPASPPLFIPMPFVPFGTMGAVIVQGSGFADRRALFDIAISGPLAGLIVALPVAWYGLQTSEIVEVTAESTAMIWGDPLILEWLIELQHGPLAENQEVILNPLLFAGWVGIFITALNLMPIGQLDGGHIMYTLIGRHAHLVANGVILGAFLWMIYTLDIAYALMVGLLIMFGTRHPPTADDSAKIGPVRAVLGVLTLAFVVIGFTPRPLTIQQPDPQPIQLPGDAVAV